jgi:Domain of unknown function (DUF4389)
MSTHSLELGPVAAYPVRVQVVPLLDGRNRITTAFRIVLALPHLLLVGGPLAAMFTWSRAPDSDAGYGWSGGGVLGAAAVVVALISWFAILFTRRHPDGLWHLAAFYLRWRVRASAYVALLRDEYPPFGDGSYPAELDLPQPIGERDRISVGFRPLLAIPQLIAIWAIGLVWALATLAAWVMILLTGRHPEPLYRFGVGALRWTARVEAYLLLLRDEYPPFTLAER